MLHHKLVAKELFQMSNVISVSVKSIWTVLFSDLDNGCHCLCQTAASYYVVWCRSCVAVTHFLTQNILTAVMVTNATNLNGTNCIVTHMMRVCTAKMY
jgi:hypothetical protein